MTGTHLSPLENRLLADWQHDFPLEARPFARVAEQYGVSEETVMAAFEGLQQRGVVGRIGAVYRTGTAGASTLAAMQVPREHLDAVAARVGAFDEVNHNYERAHPMNLWFVVTAPDTERLDAVVEAIEAETGLSVLCFPMEEAYHLDLGFALPER